MYPCTLRDRQTNSTHKDFSSLAGWACLRLFGDPSTACASIRENFERFDPHQTLSFTTLKRTILTDVISSCSIFSTRRLCFGIV